MIGSVIRTFLMAAGLGSLISYALAYIGSDYLIAFLKQNIVSIQIGLLAINAATLGVVLTKLRDLVEKGVPVGTFAAVRSEMLLSIKEQMALIVSALVILSLSEAKSLGVTLPAGLLQMLLVTCFTYSLIILYDTAKSVFVVLSD